MYNLIGIKEEITYKTNDSFEFINVSNVVATFDTKEAAEIYAEKSKLSTYSNWCSWRDLNKQFRKGSLLRGYAKFEIEESSPESPPLHNPEL